MRQRIYILYCHYWYNSGCDIKYATTNFERIKRSFHNLWADYDESGYNAMPYADITPDSLEIVDFGFDIECCRFVIQSFDIYLPENKILYAIFKMGYNTDGEGEIIELTTSQDEGIRRILDLIPDKIDRSNISDYIYHIQNNITLCDDESNEWRLKKFKVSD